MHLDHSVSELCRFVIIRNNTTFRKFRVPLLSAEGLHSTELLHEKYQQ
jgi:hypothetical protein